MNVIWFKNACILLLPWANDSKVKVWQIQSIKQTQVSIELEQLQHMNNALKRSSAIGVVKIKEGSIKLPLWYKWWLTQDLFRTLLNTCNGVFLQKSWKSLHHRFLTVSQIRVHLWEVTSRLTTSKNTKAYLKTIIEKVK